MGSNTNANNARMGTALMKMANADNVLMQSSASFLVKKKLLLFVTMARSSAVMADNVKRGARGMSMLR